MARNTSVSLGEHFNTLIADLIQRGRYGSVSEIVREGLRLVEERERRLDALRESLREGEESGLSNRNADDIIEAVERRLATDGDLPADAARRRRP